MNHESYIAMINNQYCIQTVDSSICCRVKVSLSNSGSFTVKLLGHISVSLSSVIIPRRVMSKSYRHKMIISERATTL